MFKKSICKALLFFMFPLCSFADDVSVKVHHAVNSFYIYYIDGDHSILDVRDMGNFLTENCIQKIEKLYSENDGDVLDYDVIINGQDSPRAENYIYDVYSVSDKEACVYFRAAWDLNEGSSFIQNCVKLVRQDEKWMIDDFINISSVEERESKCIAR